MPDNGIFGSDNGSTQTQTSQQQGGDPTKEALAILVGEGRKYKSPEELAKAYISADEFIEKLKGENQQLRQVADRAKTVEEVLERLERGKKPDEDDNSSKKPADTGLSAERVAQIVRDQLTGLETQKSRESNLLKADGLMKEVFGEKAKEVFEREAKTPELRRTYMELAAVDPVKFVALFKGEGSQNSQVDSTNRVNSAALENTNQSGRAVDPATKEYYDNLRRKEPAKYYSSAVQLQMTKAAESNPDKFFGRKRA